MLLTLIGQRGQLVTKHELLDAVWAGLVVEENNLAVQVGTLRKLLGPEVIATIAGRGYRFTARMEDETPRTVASVAARPAHLAAPAATPTNMPKQLAPLYGRSHDLDVIGHQLEGHRLVTLAGAGGIGKSRLAQALAHRSIEHWPDGVWMVELAGLYERRSCPMRWPRRWTSSFQARAPHGTN